MHGLDVDPPPPVRPALDCRRKLPTPVPSLDATARDAEHLGQLVNVDQITGHDGAE